MGPWKGPIMMSDALNNRPASTLQRGLYSEGAQTHITTKTDSHGMDSDI